MGLTKASALDLGPHGITVNCIGPGPFLTDMLMSLLSDVEKDEFSRMTALGRWGTPRELAGPALLLVSESVILLEKCVLLMAALLLVLFSGIRFSKPGLPLIFH